MFSKSIPSYPFTEDSRFKSLQKYFQFINTKDYTTDFGHIISKKPIGIFLPPTIEHLQNFLKLANLYQISVVCRGKGNSTYGQSQCFGGVVIDLKNMDLKMDFATSVEDSLTIPAFYTWLEVTNFTKMKNKTVPVTVDNLDLTVGGTLCFAALGGPSYRVGSGADNVLSLEVLTIDGEKHHCSRTENAELFNAVLCGLGQFGIILTVTIPLIEAKKLANMYIFTYENSSSFLKDQKKLYDKKVFDHLKGFVQKNNGKWQYAIEACSYFNAKEDDAIENTIQLLTPGSTSKQTLSYWDFINQVTRLVEALKNAGKFDVPHPWYNVLLTEEHVENHLLKVLESKHLTGTEPVIIYPVNSELFNLPFFMKPVGPVFYILGVLFNTSFEATPEFPFEEVIKENTVLYEDVKNHQGSRYLVDAHAFNKEDWKLYFGSKWNELCFLKNKYDPNHLLAPSFNLFKKDELELNELKQVCHF
ncbi:MAG: FAD-binding protein [Tatlockia sp.]|nr:FAD-binding protein [Tatlockia sp.]